MPQGLNPHCLSLCKCSSRFNLWRVQPDVLCNDVVWGMTRASREEAARLQMLFTEREQVVVWGLGTDAAMSCLIAAVTLELWNVDMDSPAQEVTAVQLQHWEWQTHCIMLPNIFTTPGQARYVTPYKRCSLWAQCCHCTPPWIKKTSGPTAGRIKHRSHTKGLILLLSRWRYMNSDKWQYSV